MATKVSYAGAVGNNSHNDHLFFPQKFHDTAAGKIHGHFIRPIDTKDDKPAVIFTTLEMKVLSDNVKFTLVGKFQLGQPKMDKVRKYFENLKLIGGWKLGVLDGRHLLIRIQKKEDYVRLFAQQSVLIAGTQMQIIKWTSDFDPSKEPPIVPMWFKLPGLPFHLYNPRALYNISQALGTPLRVDAPTYNMVSQGGDRVQVERDFTLPDVDRFWITDGADGFWQEAVVESRPFCQHCKMFGHIRDTCYRLHPPSRKRVVRPSAVVGNSQHGVDATLAQVTRVASDANNSADSAFGDSVVKAVGETPQQVAPVATPVATVATEQVGRVALPPVVQTAQAVRESITTSASPTADQTAHTSEYQWQVYTSRRKKKTEGTLLLGNLMDDTLVSPGNGESLQNLIIECASRTHGRGRPWRPHPLKKF